MLGKGGDNYLAGTADLDGDGLIETVFSDNYCYPPMGPCIGSYSHYVGNLYVYENGALVYEDPQKLMLSTYLGDTDGNGIMEIIGLDTNLNGKLRILENNGSDNGFVEVYYESSDYSFYLIDAENDGVSEFWQVIDSGTGQKDIFTLAHRSGNTIVDFYNSEALLQGFTGDIRTIVAIGDTNSDGNMELAIQQGNSIHILERSEVVVTGDKDKGHGNDQDGIDEDNPGQGCDNKNDNGSRKRCPT